MTMLERFEAKYTPEPNSGCWLWTSPLMPNGYGQIGKGGGKGRAYAHRVAWQLFRGLIPAGTCVLHKCDVRCCVNPTHLFLGSIQDNHDDMRRKDRHCRGERRPEAKVTDAIVREIRRLAADGMVHRAIAAQYGLKRRHVGLIVTRDLWRHL